MAMKSLKHWALALTYFTWLNGFSIWALVIVGINTTYFYTRNARTNAREPKNYLGRVFNFKLGCFCRESNCLAIDKGAHIQIWKLGPGADVIKLFTALMYCQSMVKLPFCVRKVCYLGNYNGMVVNYHGKKLYNIGPWRQTEIPW